MANHNTHSQKSKKAAGQLKVIGNSLRRSAEFSTLGSSKHDLTRSQLLTHQTIESEYIKNLRRQIMLLEAEVSYLRDQDHRENDIQARVAIETQRLRTEIKELEVELQQVKSNVQSRTNEADRLERARALDKLKTAEQAHRHERQQLLDEMLKHRRAKEDLEHQLAVKDDHVAEIQHQLEATILASRGTEMKLNLASSELSQKSSQITQLQKSLDEKRAQLLKSETRVQQLQERLQSSANAVNDKVKNDLRDEIRKMKQKIKAMEMSASQDGYLRAKLSDDNAQLVRENARLSQQLTEKDKQLDRERSLRNNIEEYRSLDIAKLTEVREVEMRMHSELEENRLLFAQEQERTQHFLQLSERQEQQNQSQLASLTAVHNRLAELTVSHQKSEDEIVKLRHDKGLLIEHVAELQRQLDDKQLTIDVLHRRLQDLETNVENLEQLRYDVQSSLHGQKWDEFRQLADTMRSLTRTWTAH